MKIHLTKKEYRLLLDMIYISRWIMTAQHVGVNERAEPYNKVEQKLLSYAKDFGFENLITFDKNRQEYEPTHEHESDENINTFIEEYEEDSFWDTLCTRLSQRDLLEELGIDKLKEMDPIERWKEEGKYAPKYEEEFEKNGIMNLFIKDD